MKRTISFGKYAIYSNRKINEVTIDIELRETDEKQILSICGKAWNMFHTDIIMGGQCLDELYRYVKNPLFKEIYRLWKEHHLNDLHAGTPEQEKAIEKWKEQGNIYDYVKACEYLKSVGLYEVEYNGEFYRYGTKCIYKPIPENDLKLIKHIIENGNLPEK